MKKFTVLFRHDAQQTLTIPFRFDCLADDSEHAKEQCLNAYPNCEIVWITELPTEHSLDEKELKRNENEASFRQWQEGLFFTQQKNYKIFAGLEVAGIWAIAIALFFSI
jgi:galactose-1-phosphate uridylyltransferase